MDCDFLWDNFPLSCLAQSNRVLFQLRPKTCNEVPVRGIGVAATRLQREAKISELRQYIATETRIQCLEKRTDEKDCAGDRENAKRVLEREC